MKRIALWILSTISAVVLLLGYHTSTAGTMAATTSISTQTPVTGSATSSSSSGAPPTGGTTGGTTGSSSGSSSGSTTVTGDVAQTRWGPVQVALTVASGTITDVSVLQYPASNGHDVEINQYALSVLIQETLDAQGANIDMVSGATVTSDGYLQSLQSALDQAHL